MECAGPECDKVGEKRCSRCLCVSYCGPMCQRADWDGGHKAHCKKLAVERLAKEAALEAAKSGGACSGGCGGGGGGGGGSGNVGGATL
jgi:hypothetical protein